MTESPNLQDRRIFKIAKSTKSPSHEIAQSKLIFTLLFLIGGLSPSPIHLRYHSSFIEAGVEAGVEVEAEAEVAHEPQFHIEFQIEPALNSIS